ncbi:MAG TPA: choice-of-anchor A family protein [Ignavibacteriales bacterium]|nr:choice-of-anchor A family protein [Ignavibacteriales bacterium]
MNKVYFSLILILAIAFSSGSLPGQDQCDLSGFVTFSKTEWGADANGNNAGTIRDIYFLQAFPMGLTVGGTFTITLISSKSTAAFLRHDDPPGKLTKSYTDPASTESGLLGVQLAALKLNIAADGLSPAKKTLKLTDLVITRGKFSGKTVAEFSQLANAALGGGDISGLGYSYLDLSDAAASINENFNKGEVNKGFLACKSSDPQLKASLGGRVWNDENNNGIQDSGETGLQDVKVELRNCTGVIIRETTTDALGRYIFADITSGSYFLKLTSPGGYFLGKLNQGADDQADSDFKSDGQTDCFEFSAEADKLTIDCALVKITGADIEVSNTVSKTSVKCGESFTFTVTARNIGNLDASSVAITDLLPSGTEYISSTAAAGAYNAAAGEWTLGSLNAGQSATLIINVKSNCSELSTNSAGLGAAEGFNVFVLETISHPYYSTVQGKVAAGGDASLSGYNAGEGLPANSNDVLIVGGNLTFTSGTVKNGNVVYGGTTNLPQAGVSITGGSLRHDHPIDFAGAATCLQNFVLSLKEKSSNTSAVSQWGGLTLKGSDPVLNVFNVSGSEFSGATYFVLNVPDGSAVLVNVGGQSINWTGGMSLIGASAEKVIYNFYQAQTIRIQGVEIKGCLLAPSAAVDLQSGIVNGQLIVKSLSGSGQFNNILLDAGILAKDDKTDTQTLISTASLTSCSPEDANADNNTSSVTVLAGNTSRMEKDVQPCGFSLRQNYPNPFNPSTTIDFTVPSAGKYSIKVFNMLGQEVTTLLERDLPAGYHRTVFDASKVPSGVYIYRLSGSNVHLFRKMVLAK